MSNYFPLAINVSGEQAEGVKAGTSKLMCIVVYDFEKDQLHWIFTDEVGKSEGQALLARFGVRLAGNDL